MKVSTRFSDSIHILAFICIYQGKITLSSTNIAGSLETSPVVVRRLMTSLKEAGFIKTKHGTPDPELLVDPQKITLLDVYLATEGQTPLFIIDHNTNPQCIVGGNIQSTLEDYYHHAETAVKAKLQQITLQDVIDTILVKQAEKKEKQS